MFFMCSLAKFKPTQDTELCVWVLYSEKNEFSVHMRIGKNKQTTKKHSKSSAIHTKKSLWINRISISEGFSAIQRNT